MYIMRNITIPKTSMIQLPSPMPRRTDEKNNNSNPRNINENRTTITMFICHIRSITRITKKTRSTAEAMRNQLIAGM
ncbi:hypothetical protein HanPI659440_Chr03g0107181 [Helianthus annuus]|nr:hypothetical protein HanPI659440_Chr03g0107181 [Helianthus annuus]